MTGKPDAWFPFYTGDYLKDTTRLTTEQHGAYMLLLIDYYTNGAPPDDDAVLATITRMTPKGWKSARQTLLAFFTVQDGRWRQSRADEEMARSGAVYRKRVKAGQASAEARRQRNVSVDPAYEPTHVATHVGTYEPTQQPTEGQQNARQSQSQSQSQSETSKAAAPLSVPREPRTEAAARLIAEFDKARIEVFGAENQRNWPHPMDLTEAQRWLEAGAEESHCASVFRAVFQRQKATGKRPASSLGYMRNAIAEAAQAPPMAANLSPQARNEDLMARVRAAIGD